MRRELLCAIRPEGLWAVHLEDGRPVEIEIERADERPRPESIHLGIVRRIVPSLRGAFVDVGADRDALVQDRDTSAPGPRPPRGEASGDGDARFLRAHRRSSLTEGERVVVQIRRPARTGKGATATLAPALAGRLVVFLPATGRLSVSNGVEAAAERRRLSRLVAGRLASGEGAIVRAAAEGASGERLAAEIDALKSRWTSALERARAAGGKGRPPAEIDEGPGLPERIVRDLEPGGLDRIVADGPGLRSRFEAALAGAGDPPPLEGYAPEGSLLEARGVDDAVRGALARRVTLPSGGRLTIETTEALVAIDVDTAADAARSDFERTARETNREAVREIARQIRLRNAAGLIVVDFIEQATRSARRELVGELRSALSADRGRTRVLGVSAAGLVELVRRRRGPSLDEVLTARCGACGGTGRSAHPGCPPSPGSAGGT